MKTYEVIQRITLTVEPGSTVILTDEQAQAAIIALATIKERQTARRIDITPKERLDDRGQNI